MRPLAVDSFEVLQRAREIVQRDRAGVHHPERVEQVGPRRAIALVGYVLVHERPRDLALDLLELRLLDLRVVPHTAEHQIVRDERVQPVDGDEFFG